MRIIVVDDEEVIRDSLCGFLQSEGHECCAAQDGWQALATLRQSHPDLLIADLRMPGMSGPELALEVAEICSANPVPIILITSQFDYTTEKDDAINKILGVLTKPIDVNHLRDMIRSIDVVIPQA